MHRRDEPSFFFTNSTGAPHGETLGRMNCFSNKSSSCFFNSPNSAGAIRYGEIDTGPAPGIKSIANSISLLGGSPGISSGNTSINS